MDQYLVTITETFEGDFNIVWINPAVLQLFHKLAASFDNKFR